MYICEYLAFVKMVDVALIIELSITCSCGTTRLLGRWEKNNIKTRDEQMGFSVFKTFIVNNFQI